MLEGQNGFNWPRLRRIAAVVEAAGFAGLFRSDHFTNPEPPDRDSLDLWVSLTWLASHTRRIEFGPLVSPVSFRHPTHTARMAAAVDDLSEGRLTLGLGAGWQAREHQNYGHDLLPLQQRFDRFAEGLEVITRLLHSETPVDFEGQYYQLQDAILLPRPQRPGGPPILIGGNGPRRTLPLVAKYAAEWNALYIPMDEFRQTNRRVNALLAEAGRAPHTLKRSLMTLFVFGQTRAEVARKAERLYGRTPEALIAHGAVVGDAGEVVDSLGALAEAGLERVMLQWLDLDDLAGLETVARSVLPQLENEPDAK